MLPAHERYFFWADLITMFFISSHIASLIGWNFSSGMGRVEKAQTSFFFFEALKSVSVLFLGRVHATDYSNASATGIFDSYQVRCLLLVLAVSLCRVRPPVFFFTSLSCDFLPQMCWSQFLCSLVSLPLSIFPKVENTGWVKYFKFCITE